MASYEFQVFSMWIFECPTNIPTSRDTSTAATKKSQEKKTKERESWWYLLLFRARHLVLLGKGIVASSYLRDFWWRWSLMTDDVKKNILLTVWVLLRQIKPLTCKLLEQDIYLITFMDITNFYKYFAKNKKLRPKQLNKLSR